MTVAAVLLASIVAHMAHAVPGPPTAREADERLAVWLEQQGLDRLLAAHLQDRLDRESTDLERRDLAERLASILVRRLRKGEVEPEDAATVVARLRGFLAGVDADELTVEVLRARQRRTERRLEQLRLGHAGSDDRASGAAAIMRAFTELVTELDRLHRNLEVDLKNDDRRLDRSIGLEAEELLGLVDRKRALLESVRFLHAWSNLHLAMLARSSCAMHEASEGRARAVPDWRPRALAALEGFNALLDTGSADPSPDDVSIERRSEDAYASAILGSALSRALLHGGAAASPWFDLLSDARTSPLVRRSAPGWHLAALVLLREFDDAGSLLRTLSRRGPVPPAWLRMAVIESTAPEVLQRRGAVDFVQEALAQLASQEDLAEVVALSERLPAETLPRGGFVAGYLLGLREYASARDSSQGQREAFLRASRTLLAAVRETEAATFPIARAAAKQLAAWCLVGAGDPAGASALFEDAAEELPPSRAAESLWLAAEAAARAAERAEGAERRTLEQAWNRIVARLIERHPESAFATRAEVARIRGGGATEGDELARLLAVPRSSPAWPEAQQAAEELLYRRLREATESERARVATQYLELTAADSAPSGEIRRTWLRRRIEAALVLGSGRINEAAAAIDALRARAAAGEFRIDDLDEELVLRELQVATLRLDLEEAMRLLRALEAGGADRAILRIARRSILRAAPRAEGDAAIGATVLVGGELLADERDELDDLSFAAIAMIVGRAALLQQSPSEAPQRPASRSLPALAPIEALRHARDRVPNDMTLVDLLASLAERHGDDDLALECLRSLLASHAPGDPPWFDARLRQVRILARVDPARARAVLDQHRALVPEWGPPPWGSELRALDRMVPPASETVP